MLQLLSQTSGIRVWAQIVITKPGPGRECESKPGPHFQNPLSTQLFNALFFKQRKFTKKLTKKKHCNHIGRRQLLIKKCKWKPVKHFAEQTSVKIPRGTYHIESLKNFKDIAQHFLKKNFVVLELHMYIRRGGFNFSNARRLHYILNLRNCHMI